MADLRHCHIFFCSHYEVYLCCYFHFLYSAKYSDVDENGVQYMILCRVIMGNMELVCPGSKQFHPSGEDFDNGVDSLENPKCYVVWTMNMSTHIFPEYVVSFKLSPDSEGDYLSPFLWLLFAQVNRKLFPLVNLS